jgi:hypothetical protein
MKSILLLLVECFNSKLSELVTSEEGIVLALKVLLEDVDLPHVRDIEVLRRDLVEQKCCIEGTLVA